MITNQLNETDSWRLYSLLYSRVVNAYLDSDRFTHDENIFIELNSKWYILFFISTEKACAEFECLNHIVCHRLYQ